MKTLTTLLCLALAPAAASAATVTCNLVGEVKKSSETAAIEGSAVYEFELTIAATGAGDEAACQAHVGKKMTLDLTLPTRVGTPKAGDRIGFERRDVEDVGGDYVDYRFVALNPPPAAQP